MGRFLYTAKAYLARDWIKWCLLPVAAAAVVGSVISAATPPSIPAIDIAAEPLYARGARAKPTLTLALSVEFPTVGAQYVDTPGATSDASYLPTNEYIGYFDAESCYSYNATPTETRPTGVPVEDYRRFDRMGDAARNSAGASLHTCGGTGFSGNYLNWASSSAIDILRFGLTGGDRVVDTTALTVLQRAYLPNTSVSGNFWNASNFPSKRLLATYAAGAVPDVLRGTHTGDIYAANCFNRIHFGTQATGSCASPGNNSNLGTGTTLPGTVTDYNGTLPSNFSASCAGEGGTCSFADTREVAYGAGTKWKFKTVTGGTACTNGVFGDPIVGTVKNCYTRPAAPTGGMTPDGFFYTRVAVCGTNTAGELTDPRKALCLRYPNGNYKPVGNLQKYSDRVRVAAFGYLNDATLARYGGVLRAPMKYVGDKHYDANFALISGTNPVREWESSTGIFIINPDAAAEGKSGVTTYLNQFGRTGILGQYKTYDPVSELYYESLRYLQGLAPTSQAVSGMNATLKDGFPVTDTWTDPHPAVTGMTDYSCIKNNIVGIGDVNTHADKSLPGNNSTTGSDFVRSADTTANLPDMRYWTKIVGAFEEGRSETYVDGKGASRTTSNPNTPNPITPDLEDKVPGDVNGYLMAGAAYWANTHDIRGTQWSDTAKRRPGMRVRTYILDVNEYGQQTAQSTHKNNQFFLASKYGGFRDITTTGNPFKSLGDGNAVIDSNENWERAKTGEAKNYFLSSSAKDVLAALDTIFENIAQEANSIAGGAISTQRLTSVGGFIYQAQFDPSDWSGDLLAYPVAVNASGTSVDVGPAASSAWKNAVGVSVGAAGKLDDKLPANRKIFVGESYGKSAAQFLWNSVDANTQTWLRTPAGSASSVQDAASTAEARLLFLRGDRSNEAGGTGTGLFRKRSSRLGDIVNSGVAFSGAPTLSVSDSDYVTFYNDHKDRRKALFVGANDGMLHSFDADTGEEMFAYIPSWLVPKLTALTSPAYTHRAYLDGTPVVAEAKVNGVGWKTVLVAGTGGGGQGVFALDVSNPDPGTSTTAPLMWEFTDRDDPAMGNVIGKPQIVKIRVSAPGATPEYRYFAMVASGVNNYVDDGQWSNGSPALFILDLSKPLGSAWSLGSNYFRVDLPLSTTSTASGMANFTVRTGFADEVTQVYAGDLHGNLWKLDFSKVGSTNWNMEKLSFYADGTTPIPMFVANTGATDATRQPITMAPTLIFGEQRSIIVLFGTGKFLEVADTASPFKAQSVYSILDNGKTDNDTASAAIGGRGRLMAGTTSSTGVTIGAFSWGRPTTDNATGVPTVRAGWYFDFFNSATSGERQISNFAYMAGNIVFGTVIPAENSCDNGKGNLYIINALSGGGSSEVSSVGILGEPFIAQLGSSTVTNSDTTGARKETARFQVILQGSAGLAAPPSLSRIETLAPPGRVSWREISNYQELRNKP